ncbi:DUF6497 family protein [Pseudooceanicola sp.]|uniref:DUF6497 family protein n=1 Tax=Pseudooceanicola sp. TaxID=1914328 RepID=UPI00260BE264|nr:DUF6497 family protein [Pseudooceanicola sp.]MDF1853957.1 DUF6497 family protein [Pseudooceanicola sp.]
MRLRLAKIVAAGGALTWAATTAPGQEEAPTVPSGISLTLQEVLLDTQVSGGALVRFRYVAPAVQADGFAAVEADFPALCTQQVLPWAATQPTPIARTVISMASAEVEFGVASPDVIQFFEQFQLQKDACIWEGF